MANEAWTLELGAGGITRRDALRRLGVGAAVLTLPGLLAACGGDGDDGGGASAQGGSVGGRGSDAEIDSITWSLGAAPPTLDIATGYVTQGQMVMTLALEGLMTVDDELHLRMLLAESRAQPDQKTYVYQLRRDVRFWDGTPLTAEDVAWSINRHLDPRRPSQIAAFYAHALRAEATGEHEVTVRLRQPDPVFEYVLTFSYVTPKALGERLGDRLGAPGPEVNTIGTGPYRVTSFDGETQITIERNEEYWGERPRVRSASLKFIADPQASLMAIRGGEIDGMFEFPLLRAREWDRVPNVNTEYVSGLTIAYLSFDLSMAPWDDPHVRRAVAHATDRAGYVKAFLGGHGRPATAIPAPEAWANLASPDEVEQIYASLRDYPYDVEAAKRELAQSDHADGFSAEVSVPAGATAFSRALVSLRASLEQLGIELTVREVSRNAWIANLYAHENLGLQLMTLAPDYVDPSNFVQGIYPSVFATRNGFNTANFRDPQVDRLYDQQARTDDRATRVRALAEILRISAEQLPYFPLWWASTPLALSDRYVYEGFTPAYYNQDWLTKLRVRA